VGDHLGHRHKGLADLRPSASNALASYTDPANHFAFHTYDRLGDPGAPLSAEDVLLANLLSLRLGWREVIPLFSTNGADGNAHALRDALDAALVALRNVDPFEDHPSVEHLEETVAPLARANEAARTVPQWTYVTVSKVLHRRLPHIVPIIDSRVRAFYGARGPQSVRAALWQDVRENRDWLTELAGQHHTPDGRAMSVLRCADILIWSAS
jgi:hypothetical protein